MAVTTDIVAMYRRPRAVVHKQLAMGQREDRALIYLMLACGLIFVAQWPRLAREAHLDDAVPLQALVGGALMAWLFVVPLAMYGIAALSRVIAGLLGGQGTWITARLTLFWALLAAAPLWLLTGLTAGFVGPGPALSVTGAVALAAFVLFWGVGLVESERAGVPA